jgi:hypothetical protein
MLPKGMESNWVQTGEDWFTIFRLYGPEKSVLEQTWRLNDFEKVEGGHEHEGALRRIEERLKRIEEKIERK